jgi:hypothetical protein
MQAMLKLLSLLFIVNSALAQEALVNVDQYREASLAKWKGEIAEFDKRNASETHPDDAILFCGSSSIRLWETIREDIAPYHPIQRGFGGSNWSEVAAHAPNAQAFFIATTPSEKRWQAWPKIRKANELIAEWAKSTPNTAFISTEDVFLNNEGSPNPEFFVADRLHLSRTGYQVWSSRIVDTLNEKLGTAKN